MDEFSVVWWRAAMAMPSLQWPLLLACAALVGYGCQRYAGVPKVVGYSLVGAVAGWLGFDGVLWPLQGVVRWGMELGVALVLFECAGRIPLRWFRYNPMVLLQSMAESALTYGAVLLVLRWLGQPMEVAAAVALIAVAASPSIVTRVVADNHAAGPLTERAIALATLSTLYALVCTSVHTTVMLYPSAAGTEALMAGLTVLAISLGVAAVLALILRLVLSLMSPTSENTSLVLLALVAVAVAIASHAGGSPPLAGLLAGMVLKQIHPRPWVWPQQLGNTGALITIWMLVVVSCVAAQAPWSMAVMGTVLIVMGVRLVAKASGVALGHAASKAGGRASWHQALWLGCAMMPMSAVALLIASQWMHAAPHVGQDIAALALPAIFLMELLGALGVAWALSQSGECTQPSRSDPSGDKETL